MSTPEISLQDIAGRYTHITLDNQEGFSTLFKLVGDQATDQTNIFLPVGAREELLKLGVKEVAVS